jgi:uncharacterized Zn finger protein
MAGSRQQVAGGYLRRAKRALKSCEKSDQWSRCLATLREANRRRPRCIEVLDRLSKGDRPIIED